MLGHVSNGAPLGKIGHKMGMIRDKMVDFGFFGPWTWIFGIIDSIIPADKRMVMFGSNHGMHASDNSFALFRHINNNPGNLRALWITRNRDVYETIEDEFPGKCVIAFSLKGLFSYFRSYQVVISHSYLDMCLMPYCRRKRVNYLWHGVPIRKIGKMLEMEENNVSRGIVKHWSRWNKRVDCFFASCEYEKEIMKDAFKLEDMEIIVSGYPRNDRIIENVNKERKKRSGGGFTILYAPTYRILNSGDKSKVIPLLHPEIELNEMDIFLEENNCNLIIRPHPLLSDVRIDSERIECISVDDEPDLSKIFDNADLLVTDYSSAYFDWLILDRPVIFSVFDLPEYSGKVGFIQDIEKIAAGEIVDTKDSVFEALEDAISMPDMDSSKYSRIRKKFGIKRKSACGKIAEIIESHSN